MTENNKNIDDERAALFKDAGSEQSKHVTLKPEEVVNVLGFLKQRVADLTLELSISEARNGNLINYIKTLESKLAVPFEDDIEQLKHPDIP